MTETTPGLSPTERLSRLEDLVSTALEQMSQDREANDAAFTEIGDALTRVTESMRSGGEGDAASGEARPWVSVASADDWRGLVEWVDWMSATYALRSDLAIPPCWPSHPGVAEELAALWRSWQDAAIRAADPDPNDALAFWHDRYLAPVVQRLQALYGIRQCRHDHEPDGEARRTDATRIPDVDASEDGHRD